ncbi:hypothetical protein AB1Y20_014888 [Prymnesium parvum]|uniref:Zn(2)-C6 fungal-type domain-containing protein n=1 Tax=Prymnesium parvum TaxID=97485 RepID=A0AB34JWU3_PRYPA
MDATNREAPEMAAAQARGRVMPQATASISVQPAHQTMMGMPLGMAQQMTTMQMAPTIPFYAQSGGLACAPMQMQAFPRAECQKLEGAGVCVDMASLPQHMQHNAQMASGFYKMSTSPSDSQPRPCAACRAAKVRCDRELPCSRCTRLQLECMPPQNVQRGRPSRKRLLQRSMQHQMAFATPAMGHQDAMLQEVHMATNGHIAPEPHVHGGNFFLMQQQKMQQQAAKAADGDQQGSEEQDGDDDGDDEGQQGNGYGGAVHGGSAPVGMRSMPTGACTGGPPALVGMQCSSATPLSFQAAANASQPSAKEHSAGDGEGTIRGGALFASLAQMHGVDSNVASCRLGRTPSSNLAKEESSGMPPISPSTFQMMWDLLPLAVFIRDRQGAVLYANSMGMHMTGCSIGVLPSPWQLTPRHGPSPSDNFAPMASNGTEMEHDLPNQLSTPTDPPPPLPPASTSYHLVVVNSSRSTVQCIDVLRMPFWISSSRSKGASQAAVLYMAYGTR